MKTLDIALKDIRLSFRSAFALVFMFAVPILITGMFYFMFGGTSDDDDGSFDLAAIQVVIVNLDEGRLPEAAGNDGGAAASLGQVLAQLLQDEELDDLLRIREAADADSARAAVDEQEAQVAIIIPANFTEAILEPAAEAEVELYPDPSLVLGPEIVRTLLSQIIDDFSGAKIALDVTTEQTAAAGLPIDHQQVQQIIGQYQQRGDQNESLVVIRAPGAQDESSSDPLTAILAPIMGGMMVFYAFFTGAASAQSILTEEENGTLQRLFSTPTTRRTILTGKFLAAGLTVLIQVIVLLVFARIVFDITWGEFANVAVFVIGTVFAAATFGVFLISLMRSSRQSGVIFGGVLTLTGMLAMLPIFTSNSPNTPPLVNTVALLVPQGWVLRGLSLAREGSDIVPVLLNLLVLLIWSGVFFVLGRGRLRNRFA